MSLSQGTALDFCTTVYALPISQGDAGGYAACSVCACYIGAYCINELSDGDEDPDKDMLVQLIIQASIDWNRIAPGRLLSVEEVLSEFDLMTMRIGQFYECMGLPTIIHSRKFPRVLREEFNLISLPEAFDSLIERCDAEDVPSVLVLVHKANTILIYMKNDDSSWIVDTHARDIYTGMMATIRQSHVPGELSGVATSFKTRMHLYNFIIRLFGEYILEENTEDVAGAQEDLDDDDVLSTLNQEAREESEIVIDVAKRRQKRSTKSSYDYVPDVAKYQFALHALIPRPLEEQHSLFPHLYLQTI